MFEAWPIAIRFVVGGALIGIGAIIIPLGGYMFKDAWDASNKKPEQPAQLLDKIGRRHLTAQQKAILRDNVRPGTKVALMPLIRGEPNAFAHELADALTLAGARVDPLPGETTNMIMNGQTGILLQYDHADPGSAQIFVALQRAGLNPVDISDLPNEKIALIKVGPIE